jgi:acyl-coenzyme A synthetase/AMP-(fatty) acid ligase
VTLRGGGSLKLEALCRYLAAEGFSKHFWPERLEVLAEMPRTPTGKIQKFVLREVAKNLKRGQDPFSEVKAVSTVAGKGS